MVSAESPAPAEAAPKVANIETPAVQESLSQPLEAEMKKDSLQDYTVQGAPSVAVQSPAPVEKAKREAQDERHQESQQRTAATAARSPALAPPPEAIANEVIVTGHARQENPQDSAMPVDVVSSEDLADLGRGRVGPRNTVPAPSSSPRASSSADLAEVVTTGTRRISPQSAAGPRGTVRARRIAGQ